VALSNTTLAVFMSALDGSIVLISLPAIFRGIHLDPLAPGNVVFLLWMIMGYRLVQAVFVVALGRLGDMFGRVKTYNAGFVVFTGGSILLSFDPLSGARGALWLIGWRTLQALGGSMLTANSAAILTDAFPAGERGFALGTNQVAAIAGQFIGLVAGGLLAAIDWRAVFWINVPVGVFGTVWAYRMLSETGERHRGRIDWWGNASFAVGLSAILTAITTASSPTTATRWAGRTRRCSGRSPAAPRCSSASSRSRGESRSRCSSSASSASVSSPRAARPV
jgi:MFS family permease